MRPLPLLGFWQPNFLGFVHLELEKLKDGPVKTSHGFPMSGFQGPHPGNGGKNSPNADGEKLPAQMCSDVSGSAAADTTGGREGRN